jgi:outer membrane protein assembly factor BamB
MYRWFAAVPALALLVLPLAARDTDGTKPSTGTWTQLRGPTGQGYIDDAKVPLEWSEEKNVLWKAELPGMGNSSPMIWGDRIFLTSASEGGADRFVICARASDGKILWQKTAASGLQVERTHGWNGYASPSCAVDGSHVVAFFGTPGVFCYDFEGKELWNKKLGIFVSKAGWGTAASPFIYEDTVILNCDNDGGPGAAPAALLALETKTGKVRWSTPREQGRGFSTPRLLKNTNGRIDLVLNGPLGMWGYDPKTGKELWQCRRSDPKDQMRFGEPLPVDDGERLFVLSGRTGPFQIVKMPDHGDVTATHVLYTGTRAGHRDVSSPMLWKDRVYQIDIKGVMSYFDLKSGKEIYRAPVQKRECKSLASPITVRGKLLWLLDDGTTIVVQPGDKPTIVSRNKLGQGKSLDFGASPAVVNGRLYVRSQTHLYCIGEK